MSPAPYQYPDYSEDHAPQAGLVRFQFYMEAERWAARANLDGPVSVLVHNCIYGFAPVAQRWLTVPVAYTEASMVPG